MAGGLEAIGESDSGFEGIVGKVGSIGEACDAPINMEWRMDDWVYATMHKANTQCARKRLDLPPAKFAMPGIMKYL